MVLHSIIISNVHFYFFDKIEIENFGAVQIFFQKNRLIFAKKSWMTHPKIDNFDFFKKIKMYIGDNNAMKHHFENLRNRK